MRRYYKAISGQITWKYLCNPDHPNFEKNPSCKGLMNSRSATKRKKIYSIFRCWFKFFITQANLQEKNNKLLMKSHKFVKIQF